MAATQPLSIPSKAPLAIVPGADALKAHPRWEIKGKRTFCCWLLLLALALLCWCPLFLVGEHLVKDQRKNIFNHLPAGPVAASSPASTPTRRLFADHPMGLYLFNQHRLVSLLGRWSATLLFLLASGGPTPLARMPPSPAAAPVLAPGVANHP